MKKLFVISALFSTLFLLVSCGEVKFNNPNDKNSEAYQGDDSEIRDDDAETPSERNQGELYGECYPNKTCNEGLECDAVNNICIKETGGSDDLFCSEEGTFRCSGDTVPISQMCDEGSWKNFEQCINFCDPDTGRCVSSGDTGDTGSGDTGSDTGVTGGGYDTCADIYQCATGCSDQACFDACIAEGTPAAQDLFNAMYVCWGNNCANASTNDEFIDCIDAYCANETEACGIIVSQQGDTNYPAPYGTLQINVASTYIITNEASLDQSMVNMSSFATGNLGSYDIVPADMGQSYYFASLFTDSSQQYFQIIQYYVDSTGNTLLNPGIFIIIPATVAPGAVHFGLDHESVGQMFVVDLNDGAQTECYHGFGYGDLTVTSVNPVAGAAGNISVVGTIEIYSAANAPMYGGNISSQLGSTWVDCAPMLY